MALKTVCTGANVVGTSYISSLVGTPYTIHLAAYGTSGTITGTIGVSNSTDKFYVTDNFTVSPSDTAPTLLAKAEPYAYTQIKITSASGNATLTCLINK